MADRLRIYRARNGGEAYAMQIAPTPSGYRTCRDELFRRGARSISTEARGFLADFGHYAIDLAFGRWLTITADDAIGSLTDENFRWTFPPRLNKSLP